MKYGTSFIESELILAAIAKDFEEVVRLAEQLNDGELRALDNALDLAAEALRVERVARYDPHPKGALQRQPPGVS